MKFNVGDYVAIKRSGDFYNFTKYKSTGTVKEVLGRKLLIEFDHMTGYVPDYETDITFWIDVEHVKRGKQKTQQERVCAKIKQMEARWLKFQTSKRSCHV